jgi:hypothetical protein
MVVMGAATAAGTGAMHMAATRTVDMGTADMLTRSRITRVTVPTAHTMDISQGIISARTIALFTTTGAGITVVGDTDGGSGWDSDTGTDGAMVGDGVTRVGGAGVAAAGATGAEEDRDILVAAMSDPDAFVRDIVAPRTTVSTSATPPVPRSRS